MCETNAYVFNDGEDELFLEGVDTVRPEEGGLYLRSIFGEEKRFDGRIREVSLSRHRIVLQRSK